MNFLDSFLTRRDLLVVAGNAGKLILLPQSILAIFYYFHYFMINPVTRIPVVDWEDQNRIFVTKFPSEAITYRDFCAAVEIKSGYSSFKLYFYADTNNLIKENCETVNETTFPIQLKLRLYAIGYGVNGTGPIFFVSRGNESPSKSTGPAAGNQKIKAASVGKSTNSESANTSSAVSSEFAKQVTSRDDNTCCVCQKKGGHLEADHQVEKKHGNDSELLERYHLVSIHDIKNGLTLCKECHYLRGMGALFFNLDLSIEIDESKLSAKGNANYVEHLKQQKGKYLKRPLNPEYLDRFPSNVLSYRVTRKHKPSSEK